MKTVNIYELLQRHILVTRDSARSIQPALAAALANSRGEVALDFLGVDGLTPSFLDETLAIIEECFDGADLTPLRVLVENPPTRLSSKFAAVGRGHGLSIEESDGGDWIISRADPISTRDRRE